MTLIHKTTSRWELFEAMVNRTNVQIPGDFNDYKILAISLEDGSGHSFNLLLSSVQLVGVTKALYFRSA